MAGADALQLIAGLGNPGREFVGTRHNAGFWLVDALAAEHGVKFRRETKFRGDTCRLIQGNIACWLLKPRTYMNLSGQSVAAFAGYHAIPPTAILVVHDEVDLPPGQVRLKRGGGHGGHNGLRDIIERLGSPDFCRLRIGIGHPGNRDDVTDYVLGAPSAADREAIETAIRTALASMPELMCGELHQVMNKLNRRQKVESEK